MSNDIEAKISTLFSKWKEKKGLLYEVMYMTAVSEEILKRRRRTTLAVGAAISLLVYIIISVCF